MEILVLIILFILLLKFLETTLAGALILSAIVCGLLVAAGIESAFTVVFLPMTGILWALATYGQYKQNQEQ